MVLELTFAGVLVGGELVPRRALADTAPRHRQAQLRAVPVGTRLVVLGAQVRPCKHNTRALVSVEAASNDYTWRQHNSNSYQ